MVESKEYFELLKKELDKAYAVSMDARKKYFDPVDDVEVKIARDVAARVEGIVGPPGIAEIIRGMEKSGMQRADIAFEIAKQIASGKVFKANKEFLIEQAVRTGVGILTEGVLVAPTEGISKVKIKQNPDGSDYVAIYYAGPIRSAGGTAAALTLLLADIARRELGVGDYRATDSQVERYIEEVNTYESRVTHLQYLPPEKDIREVAKNCPICINGDPTEEIEVSAYRGIPGVETDRVRGGIPLVLCEGVALKAAKIFKYAKKLGLGWDWLQNIIKIKQSSGSIEIKPDFSYLDGLVAGRPVFSHPSRTGGFRLRYGHSRTNGIMAKNVHPATMILLDSFLAYGTHMKIERPGKGCVVGGHESLEPPVVRLKNGRVMRVRSVEQAEQIKDDVVKILFLGDILCTYGDFVKSNHPLLPSGFCTEWWTKELESKGIRIPNLEDANSAFSFSRTHDVPLHSDYTLPWHDITAMEVKQLAYWLKDATLQWDDERLSMLILPVSKEKSILEGLLVEHRVEDGKIMLDGTSAQTLLLSLGILEEKKTSLKKFDSLWDEKKEVMKLLKELSGVLIKKWAPTYIGARMGRPEKAKERKMDGSPNILFPTGSFKNRSLSKLYRSMKGSDSAKTIKVEVSRFRCTSCRALSFSRRCHVCGSKAVEEKICQNCGRAVKTDTHCDRKTVPYDKRSVDLVELFEKMKGSLGFMPEEVKGVRGLSNADRIPERLEKGFLRSKYGVYVFRDGTSRFDATDMPLSHFKPSEIGLSVEKAKELGYNKDYLGNKLENGEQLVPLACQDIVLSEAGGEYFIKVANFVDDMLVNLYGLKPFYNVKNKDDLIGHLCVGLSPHTSAGVLCRAIGFTKANVGYAHPYFHTAKRRNCDGDEDSLMLLLDSLINFSKKYLGEKRGGTMDAPLVLTIEINPSEVDDEVHCLEFASSYPLEFYQNAEKISSPGSVKIKRVKDVLGTDEQYGAIPLTHTGGYLDKGVLRTAYVQLQSIPEKLEKEFELHEKVRAVDEKDAAERLILSHFIPDLYGNLRSFSRQTFRCVNCNHIYRRVPMAGKCTKCGGNLLLTINKGGIEKYLKISNDIIEKYQLPTYLKQRLDLLEKEINNIFEDEKIKQTGLADYL